MIIYKGVLEKLKAAGYTTYAIRRDKLLHQASLTAIRNNQPVHLTTIDAICKLLQCQPGDILEYIEDDSDTAPEE